MKQHAAAIASAILLTGAPAWADPSVGFGLSLTLGDNGRVEAGLGLRLFSNDEKDSFVASAGVDYVFASKRFRPTIGAAYLGSDSYVSLDMGFDPRARTVDYSLSGGYVDAKAAGLTLNAKSRPDAPLTERGLGSF